MIPKTWSRSRRLSQFEIQPPRQVRESYNLARGMNRVFGLETEYGITVNGADSVDVVAECARRRNLKLASGQEVRLYKNNTDFFGHSYGCHDNYLMQRDVPWDRIVSSILPFLITRQIFAGAGKMGVEGESSSSQPGLYQISSRADFFSVVVSIDTMNRRPLINTRDEPHVDASRYRRFHVILGDSNMSEWATALKIGTTALVLDLIDRGQAPQLEIAQPVDANNSISREPTDDWRNALKDG